MFLIILGQSVLAQDVSVLEGTAIGTNKSGTNGVAKAFDGNLSTYYKTSSQSHGWVGLDFGTDSLGNDRHFVITKVAWVPYASSYATLGVFEGANMPNFEDAVPLYITSASGSANQWSEAEVNVSRAFRYVRYVGPCEQYCRIAELQFSGYEATGNDTFFYQATNLPVVSIHTQSGSDPYDRITEIPAIVSVTHRDGTKHFDGECTVRYRGNGSYQFPKKGYHIKLNEKHKMAGSTAKCKKWVLIPSYGDKTLMRNMLAFDISRRMDMYYTPFCQPVDVFVNGEYKGSYELCDQITVDKNRLNIHEITGDEPINDSTLTGGYLFEIDANFSSSNGDVGFKSAKKGKNVCIKSPKDSVLTTQHKSWLKNYFDAMERLIYNRDYTENGYSRYLDFESFIRYFLIGEYCSNTDTFWEMYLWKDRGDSLIHSGPVWDVDLGFDNDNRTHYCLWNNYWLYSMNTYYNWQSQSSSCYSDMRTVVGYLMDDPRMKQRLAEIWAYYRASGRMNTTALENLLEENRTYLYQSQTLNFKRWNILNSTVHQNFQALGSYDREVDHVKTFLGRRMTWVDTRANVSAANLSITIPASHWATLYLPTAFAAPAGISVYTVSYSDSLAQLQLDTVSTTEANRPYLLYGEPGTYNITSTQLSAFTAPATDGKANGNLIGTQDGLTAPMGSYILQTNAEGKTGFVRVDRADVNVSAKEAYLTLSDIADPAAEYWLDEGSEGIFEVDADELASSGVCVYSLSGSLLLTIDKGGWSMEDLYKRLGHGVYLLVTDGVRSKVAI